MEPYVKLILQDEAEERQEIFVRSEGYPFIVEKGKFWVDRPLMRLISEAFRVARGSHSELRLFFLILEDDEDKILRPSCQFGPIPV